MTTAATIVGAFIFGLPSIIAVVINYVKRKKREAFPRDFVSELLKAVNSKRVYRVLLR